MLAGEAKGAVAAGDEALHKLRRDGEGWRDLAGVEHAEAAAGAGTDVEEAAVALEPFGNGVDGEGDVGEFRTDGSSDLRVLVVDDAEHVEGGELVEVLAGWVAGFGEEQAEG